MFLYKVYSGEGEGRINILIISFYYQEMSESAPTMSGWETSQYQDRSLSYLEPCPSHSSYQYSERESDLELGPDPDQDDQLFLAQRDYRYPHPPCRQAERSRAQGLWEESGSHLQHHLHHQLRHQHHHHVSSPDLLHQPLIAPTRQSLLSQYSNHHDYRGSFPELNQHEIIQSHRY